MSGEGDKRKVSTDALETLGTIIGDGESRDAIHLAVVPMKARVTLQPGQHVTEKGYPAMPGRGVGIVDPFLTSPVLEDQGFWLVIYPRQINSLRHVWTHPAFPDELNIEHEQIGVDDATQQNIEASKAWVHAYTAKLGITYDDLMDGAEDFIRHGEYLVRGGTLEGEYTSQDFWHHYEVITGRHVPEEKKESFFSCSC